MKEGDYFYNAVLWAVGEGITSGVSDTEFGPQQPTSRAQVVTFLWNYLDRPEVETDNSFTDVEAGAWYESAINWAVENNVTAGMPGNIFGVNYTCTRGQAVTFLYGALAE